MGLTVLIYSSSLPVYLLLGPVFRVRNSPFAPEVLFSLPRFAVPLWMDDYNRFLLFSFCKDRQIEDIKLLSVVVSEMWKID
jgi:hypothetical protein